MVLPTLPDWARSALATWEAIALAWFLPSPFSRLGRLVLPALFALRRRPMQSLTLVVTAIRVLVPVIKLEEDVRHAPDSATRRALLMDGIPPIAEIVAAAFNVPAGTASAYISRELVGAFYDLEELGRGMLEAKVPHVPAPAAEPAWKGALEPKV